MITSAQDYVAAIAKKRRLESLLQEGRKEFSGYGLELFENGMRSSLDALSSAIEAYEVRSGYTQLAPRNFWTIRVKEEVVELGSGVFTEPTIATDSSPWANAKYVEVWEGGVAVLQVETSSAPFNLMETALAF